MVGAMSAGRIELFYSKSKSKADLGKGIPADWRKQLSNFWPAEVTIDGHTYPSPEAAFQAMKALYSSKPEMAKEFEVGGSIGPDPMAAKQHGTKKAYKAAGAVLKAKDWEAARDQAMFRILEARYASDPMFRKILHASEELRVILLHFERSAAKAYWGGAVRDGAIVGQNKLGDMMMRLRDGKGMQEGEAAAGPGSPVAAAAAAAAAPAPTPEPKVAPIDQPTIASMGRVSDAVAAVSFTRKVFTGRATLLAQLTKLGYKVGHLQSASPAEIDRQIQNQELNFVVTPTADVSPLGGAVHVRFHIDKALRQLHIHNLSEDIGKLDGFARATDTVVLVSKDLANESVKAALKSVWVNGGPFIIVRALPELQFNVLTHRDVPPHRVLREQEVRDFGKVVMLGKNGTKDLAGISRFDPVSRAILMRPGQVCEILRPSQSAGEYKYYRICE
jgi:ribA/ribD-fused uncharacterized protein